MVQPNRSVQSMQQASRHSLTSRFSHLYPPPLMEDESDVHLACAPSLMMEIRASILYTFVSLSSRRWSRRTRMCITILESNTRSHEEEEKKDRGGVRRSFSCGLQWTAGGHRGTDGSRGT